MSQDIPKEALESKVSRLYSTDANDRVKAAAELGEVGTPNEAPALLEVAYEDEASTVRQMAIQAYAEILGNEAIDEIEKAARNHFDEYVKLYAITVLGRLDYDELKDRVSGLFEEFIKDPNEKLRAATLRSMIHVRSEQCNVVLSQLQNDSDQLVIRNCLEALTLWQCENAKSWIEDNMNDQFEDLNLELKTFVSFYLASMGNKDAKEYLKEGTVDSFIRVPYNGQHYRGREGLLQLVDEL